MLEIHSRKSQGHRNKVSEMFRNGQGLVMFTSDVSARGMDYPDVTAVLQVCWRVCVKKSVCFFDAASAAQHRRPTNGKTPVVTGTRK